MKFFVTIFLSHREWFLLVGENTGTHLKKSVSSMVAVFSHSVVSENHKSCLVIHVLNNLRDESFSFL